jgi:hypothetical protein
MHIGSAALVALFSATSATCAKKSAKPALANSPTVLLAGRLEVRLPNGMKLEPQQGSTMAAPGTSEDETRAVLDSGDARFELIAQEYHCRRGRDFHKAVENEVRKDWREQASQVRLETLSVAPPLEAIGFFSPIPKTPRDANLIYAAFLATPDGLVQVLTFHINPSGLQDTDAWVQLSRAIVTSSIAGKRTPKSKGGERALAMSPARDLLISIPDHTTLTVKQGPDFVVHELRRLPVLPEAAPFCGIYLGGHPATLRNELAGDGPAITGQGTRKGKVLGRDVDWDDWGRKEILWSETILPYPGANDMFLHICCSAGDADELAALRGIMESARLR